MSNKDKKQRFVELEINEHLKFGVVYENSKWIIQLVVSEILKYPTIPSKFPLYEENKSRNDSLAKLLKKHGAKSENIEPIIEKFYDVAGEKVQELIKLTEPEEKVPTPPNEKYKADIVERARYIMEEGDPFQFYMDKWKSCYAVIGDDDSVGAMTLCVIASTLISNSKGIHEKVGGPSGFGKSAGITRMFALLPQDKTYVSSMSAKALFYTDLPAGTVVYCDDVDLSKEDFFTTIKQSTSDYQQVTKHTTVINGASSKCSVNPRIGWILSSVDNFHDIQLDSRFGETEVSDDIDKQVAIHEKQKEEEFNKSKAGTLDNDVLVCQCMWDILQKDGLYEIRIPFDHAIQWADIKHPRNFPFFKDLIRCMTLFKTKQRERVKSFYLSTIEDYEAAKQLYKKMEKTNATKLNSNERAILTYLRQQYQNFLDALNSGICSKEALENHGRVSSPELIGAMATLNKMTQQQVRYAIHGKNDVGGLLNKVVGLQAERMTINAFGGGNTLMRYWYTGDITDGFADTIVIDHDKAEQEITRWKNEFR